MALTDEQEARISDCLELAEHYSGKLSEWEHGFLFGNKEQKDKGFSSIQESFEEHGAAMFISDKQYSMVIRTLDKLEAL